MDMRLSVYILFFSFYALQCSNSQADINKKDCSISEYFCAHVEAFNVDSATVAFVGRPTEVFIDNFIEFMKSPLFDETIKKKNKNDCWIVQYKIKNRLLNNNEFNTLIEQANQQIPLQKEKKKIEEAERIKNDAQEKIKAEQKRIEERRDSELAQGKLHKAILNDLPGQIIEAIQQGANVNMGIGNQPPLLLAVIMEKLQSIQVLLDNGANPNISYQKKPLITHLIMRWHLKLAQTFLSKGVNLTDVEKKDIIDYIMFKVPYVLDQDAIDILKKSGYDIKDNFNSSDLSKNKWYMLLNNNLGRLGLIDPGLVDLFLKNGANSNQIFNLPDKTQWTPMLLAINSFIEARKKGGINEGCYISNTLSILSAILAYGGNINFTVKSISQGGAHSPLSYALKYDERGSVPIFLASNGASIVTAIELLLKNGGSPSNSLLWWTVNHNNPEATQLLINAGLKGEPAMLKFAISHGYSEMINILISN